METVLLLRPSVVQTTVVRLFVLATLIMVGMNNAISSEGFCVSSAAELQKALTESSDNGQYAGQDVQIIIATRTYETGSVTSNGPFQYRSSAAAGYLHMFGASPCDANIVVSDDARPIALDGRNHTQVLNIQCPQEVFIFGLTIQNGNATVAGGGLDQQVL